jgi:hypothetical protein
MNPRKQPIRLISLLVAALHGTVMAAPVTGTWTKVTGASMVLTNETTASPTWGDGTINNASASSIYSTFSAVTLTNPGDKITLSGAVELIGIAGGAENLRFGLYHANGKVPPDTTGWLGYFVQNGSGTSVVKLNERDNPNTGAFASAATGATQITTGAAPGSGLILNDQTYDFIFSIERNADAGVLITTSLKRRSDAVEFGGTSFVDPSPQSFVFDRVAYLATNGLAADKLQMTDVDITFTAGVVPAPVITASGLVAGAFQISVDGMEPATTYLLKRSSDLSSFPVTVGGTFTGATSYTFVDPSPPVGKAFYRVESVP